jgi:hypothetical protein
MAFNKKRGLRMTSIILLCMILLASLTLPGLAVQTSSDSQVKIQMYNVSRNDSTQQISPQIKLVNTGTTDVSLSDVVMRYYLTTDGDKTMNFDCWTSVGRANLTSKFIKMSAINEQADHYLELGFISDAGVIKPGQAVDIVSWFNKSDWSSFSQKNDFSYNHQSSTYVDWNQMTAYVGGELVWGTEPISSSDLTYPLNLQGAVKESSIELTWNKVDGATAYDLEVDGKLIANVVSDSFHHTGLIQGSKHVYRVKAKKDQLESDWSPAITLQLAVQENLSVPQNLMVKSTEASVDLTWSAVSKATAYDIEVNGRLIDSATSTFYTHKGLTNDTAYSYRVRAKNDILVGDWSTVTEIKTLPSPISSTKLKVNVKTGTSTATQMPSPGFEIFNETKSPIALKDVKIRYYFTIDSEKSISIGFWTTTTKDHVTTRFVKMPIPSEQADYYLEIGFTDNASSIHGG